MNTCETLAFKLQSSQETLSDLLADVSEEQAATAPAPGKWSVLNCVEHLYLVEKPISRLLTKPCLNDIDEEEAEKFGAGKIKHIMGNRESKYAAPESFAPKATFSTLAEAKTALAALRNNLETALRNGDVRFTNECIPHPVMGDFTKLDWVNFLLEHAGRHYQQIGEIKLSFLAETR